jgi:hypothetical protein
MGIFIMKNEAIVVHLWSDDNNLHQMWYPHKSHANQWINLSLKVDMDKKKASLYVDGKIVQTLDKLPKHLMDFKGKDLWIGSLAFKNSFSGKISNLLLFDYALADSEIIKLYTDGYKTTNNTITTNFEAVINVPFDKKFGDFYVDDSKTFSNPRIVSTGIHQETYSEELNLSYEFDMPEQSNGRFQILENSKKFTKLENYNWTEKNEIFEENENIFFYEIATDILDTDKFGLNTLSYDLISTEEIKTGVYKHQIKI